MKFLVFLIDIVPRHSSILNDRDGVYTRSGRLVKPPLSFWCGQREFVDQNLNVTIEQGGVDYLSIVSVFCMLLLTHCFKLNYY